MFDLIFFTYRINKLLYVIYEILFDIIFDEFDKNKKINKFLYFIQQLFNLCQQLISINNVLNQNKL